MSAPAFCQCNLYFVLMKEILQKIISASQCSKDSNRYICVSLSVFSPTPASTITSSMQSARYHESLRPNLCVSNDTFDGNIKSPLAKCYWQWAQGEPFQHCYLWDHCVGKAPPVLSKLTPSFEGKTTADV